MNIYTPSPQSDIDTLFNKTKGNLFFQKNAGYLGSLLCQVTFRWDSSIDTAGINPTTFVWNPDFFLSLDKDTRVTVLAHELWHNGYLHSVRLGDRCPDIWNQAADHRINNDLKKHGYYMGGFPYLMDPKYEDDSWTTDLIYDDLISSGGKPMERPMGSDVIYTDKQGDKDKAVSAVVGAMTTARMTGAPAGDMPGEIGMLIDKFLNPKLPWETILYNFFNALVQEEYSYARPNRRYEDPLLRGLTGRNGLEHLVYFVDVSGSITDEQVLRMNSEVKYIQEQLNPERLTLITFDHGIQDIFEFERDDPFPFIEIHGRGGTSLYEPWEYLKRNQPTACVVFTDLCVDIPENPGIPLIWVCTDNAYAEVPYGQLIHISENKPTQYSGVAA